MLRHIALDNDQTRLSPREIEILRLLAFAHYGNKSIAQALHISVNTVHSHMRRISAKVGMYSRDDLGRWGVQHPEALRGEPASRRLHDPDPDCLCPFCVSCFV